MVKIQVAGIGGGGGNAVNRMISAGVQHVDFLAVNTDQQALDASLSPNKILIGEKLTKRKGAGGKPEIGQKAAEESLSLIHIWIKGSRGMKLEDVISRFCEEC